MSCIYWMPNGLSIWRFKNKLTLLRLRLFLSDQLGVKTFQNLLSFSPISYSLLFRRPSTQIEKRCKSLSPPSVAFSQDKSSLGFQNTLVLSGFKLYLNAKLNTTTCLTPSRPFLSISLSALSKTPPPSYTHTQIEKSKRCKTRSPPVVTFSQDKTFLGSLSLSTTITVVGPSLFTGKSPSGPACNKKWSTHNLFPIYYFTCLLLVYAAL